MAFGLQNQNRDGLVGPNPIMVIYIYMRVCQGTQDPKP